MSPSCKRWRRAPPACAGCSRTCPGWSAAISPRAVGRGGYAEHYAVLYRRDRVARLRAYTVDDPGDLFAREPYVVCLKARAFDFCLLTIHVVFGRTVGPRDAEIEALGPLLDRLMRALARARLDRRRRLQPPGARRLLVIADPARLYHGPPSDPDQHQPTRLPQRLDHLLLNRRYTREWTGGADRLDFVSRVCRGDFAWCQAQVSDHAPIYATFSIIGADDD